MVKRVTFLNVVQDDHQAISGAWAAHPKMKEVADHLLIGSEGSSSRDSELHSLALAPYDFKAETLSAPKTILSFEEGGTPPRKIAVQPKGDGVIVSFETGCKLFTWEKLSGAGIKPATEAEVNLQPSEEALGDLEGAGPQNCLLFSDDGSLLASGGEDGHVRVFQWPSMEVVISVPKAMKSLKDLDISLDSGFLSATGDNSPCNIWNLSTCELVATLEPASGQRFGYSRFSRNAKKAFLFITVTKDRKGSVGVWDMTNWKSIGTKRFVGEPITSVAITHHGRRLAMGTKGGEIAIIEIEKMVVIQTIKSAHNESVTFLQFSPNDKALLSLSSDLSFRVTALDLSNEWKDWQIFLVFLAIFISSVLGFYMLYKFGDSFFQIPEGRKRYDQMLLEQRREASRIRNEHRNEEL